MNLPVEFHHEAGHAVMGWHHGITLEYVTMRPPPDSGHGGHTKSAVEISDHNIAIMVAAAGQCALYRRYSWAVPTDGQLWHSSGTAFGAIVNGAEPVTDEQILMTAALATHGGDSTPSTLQPAAPS